MPSRLKKLQWPVFLTTIWWQLTCNRQNISQTDLCKLKRPQSMTAISCNIMIKSILCKNKATPLGSVFSKRKWIKSKTKRLSELQWVLILTTLRIWDTKVNSGSEAHRKRCKSSSIPDLPSLGYSQRNAKKTSAQRKMADIFNLTLNHSKRTRKPVKLSNTVKVKFLDIQLKIKFASVPIHLTVSIICHSLLLSTLLI